MSTQVSKQAWADLAQALDVEEAARRRGQVREMTRIAPAVQRHRVASAQRRPRDERLIKAM